MFTRKVTEEDVQKFCDEFRVGVSISVCGQEYTAKVPYVNDSYQVIAANSWSDLLSALGSLSDLTTEQEEKWLLANNLR